MTLISELLSAPVIAIAFSAIGAGRAQGAQVAATATWDTAREYAVRSDRSGQRYVADELLVAYDTASSAPAAGIASRGGRMIGEIATLRIVRVLLPAGEDPLASAPMYLSLPGVRYAEPNFVGHASSVESASFVRNESVSGNATITGEPNDTFYDQQWHLKNTGQFVNPGMSIGTPGADVAAVGAWSLIQNPAPVVLAIIDSGMDFTHPEFLGRTLPGWDFISEDADPTATHPHGIWCAGIAAATADNAFQVAGLDQNCTILPLRIINSAGNGTVADLVQALEYCAANRVDVVSMSVGNFGNGQALKDALELASDAGCILVASSGNNGIGDADVSTPGADRHVITIGASTNIDNRWALSGTGAALDFVAPGRGILTVSTAHTDTATGFTGTSAAAPLAAAIVTLLKSQVPTLTQSDVYELLKIGAEDEVAPNGQDTPGRDDFLGWGRLNAWRSLAALTACPEPAAYGAGKKTSIGTEPIVRVRGVPRHSWEEMAIEIEHGVPGQLALVFHGANASAGDLSGGMSLVRPPLVRLPSLTLDADGRASFPISIPSSYVGRLRHYQGWFRDPGQTDGTNFVLTNAMAVEFCR